MKKVLLLSILLLVSATGHVQALPGDAPIQKPIKALTEKQIHMYLSGEDMGLGKTADLNGYPNPIYVMSYAADLNLSDDQAKAVLASRKRLQINTRKIGADIVDRERELDKAFAEGTVTPDELTRITTEIGALHGRLRATHLYARLEMKALLSPAQIAKYDSIRGNVSPSSQ